MESAQLGQHESPQHSRKLVFLIFLACVAVLLAGSLLVTESPKESVKQRVPRQAEKASTAASDPCEFSDEAKRSGLPALFDSIRISYIRSYPYITLYRSELTPAQMRNFYRPYVPTPDRIKVVSDTSLALADQLQKLKVNKDLLRMRERRMLYLARHFLRNYFGSPYKDNYYAGSWMSGPGRQCYQEGIAYVRLQVVTIFLLFPPGTTRVLHQIFSSLYQTGQGVRQYLINVKRGISAGMVNSASDCAAGLKCLQSLYQGFGEKKDGKAILSWLHPHSAVFNMTRFLSFLKKDPNTARQWLLQYNRTLEQSVRNTLVQYVGKPLDELMFYLRNVYPLFCVPNDVITGLAVRPIKFVYYNGSRTNQRTYPFLDTGEIMHGSGAYETVLSYFTTLPFSPADVNKIGWTMIRELYSKAIMIAQNITKENDTEKAVKEFKKYIKRPDMFLNQKSFPANESNEIAHRLCFNETAAKIFCPERYAAVEKWRAVSRSSMAQTVPLLDRFYYRTGPKKTTPTCPVVVDISFVPSEAVHSYSSSTSWCDAPALYFIPFFVDNMGPKYIELVASAHEAWPGHHLQIQGALENFRDTCPTSLDLLDEQQFTAFTEGWGMYAENPVASLDMELFQKNPLEWYGMLKSQLWRALRLVIDTGLHHRTMSRNEALGLFRDYLWETGDIAEKEVSRYQSWAGQAATYMTGQQAIWRMRRMAEKKLGARFDLREFHYQVLRNGQAPMDFLADHIDMYVQCVLDSTRNGCGEIIGNEKAKPKRKTSAMMKSRESKERRIWKLKKFLGHAHFRSHLF